jgi:hypothetical protein
MLCYIWLVCGLTPSNSGQGKLRIELLLIESWLKIYLYILEPIY